MKNRNSYFLHFCKTRLSTLLSMVFLLVFAGSAQAQLSGAIFTTDNTATGVNINLFTNKADVYLNGGPQNLNSAGLPDGDYYFQVTNPSGSVLLSTDNAVDRVLHVVGGVVHGCLGHTATGTHANGAFNPSNGSIAVQLIPYNDTPNNGGVYKVHLIPVTKATIDGIDPTVLHFSASDSKTDNFRVLKDGPPPPQFSLLSGNKWYDVNVNGSFDAGEVGIGGFMITINWTEGSDAFSDVVFTSALAENLGYYEYPLPFGSVFVVCEVLPLGPWIQTGPITGATSGVATVDGDKCWQGTASVDVIDGLDFFNVCLGPGGGKTLGFWSNKNGQAQMNDGGTMAPELALLSGYCLRNATGADFNPGSYSSFRSWLLSANATNMAYMLSAQFAAMVLNVEAGFVSGGSLVYAPGLGASDFISITDLLAAANAALCADGYTPSGDPNRALQGALKNALDRANNNLNFVQPGPCPVIYP